MEPSWDLLWEQEVTQGSGCRTQKVLQHRTPDPRAFPRRLQLPPVPRSSSCPHPATACTGDQFCQDGSGNGSPLLPPPEDKWTDFRGQRGVWGFVSLSTYFPTNTEGNSIIYKQQKSALREGLWENSTKYIIFFKLNIIYKSVFHKRMVLFFFFPAFYILLSEYLLQGSGFHTRESTTAKQFNTYSSLSFGVDGVM